MWPVAFFSGFFFFWQHVTNSARGDGKSKQALVYQHSHQFTVSLKNCRTSSHRTAPLLQLLPLPYALPSGPTVGLATAQSMLLRSSIASRQPSTSCVAGGPTPLRHVVLYRRRVCLAVLVWHRHAPDVSSTTTATHVCMHIAQHL